GGVALEKAGVDVDQVDRPRQTQVDHHPVVAGSAPAGRLPAVPHPLRLGWAQQIVRRREMSVGTVDTATTEGGIRQVDEALLGANAVSVGHRSSFDAESGDTAVGIDVETYVRGPVVVADIEGGGGVPLEGSRGNELHPFGSTEAVAVGSAGVEGEGLGAVAGEIGRVDGDGVDDAGQAEADDARIVTRLSPTASLPAVHPLPVVGELPFAPDGRRWADQVRCRGEELVVAPDHLAAVASGCEIHHVSHPFAA